MHRLAIFKVCSPSNLKRDPMFDASYFTELDNLPSPPLLSLTASFPFPTSYKTFEGWKTKIMSEFCSSLFVSILDSKAADFALPLSFSGWFFFPFHFTPFPTYKTFEGEYFDPDVQIFSRLPVACASVFFLPVNLTSILLLSHPSRCLLLPLLSESKIPFSNDHLCLISWCDPVLLIQHAVELLYSLHPREPAKS